jgi:hypothetical protein
LPLLTSGSGTPTTARRAVFGELQRLHSLTANLATAFQAFLTALADTGIVSAAASIAGITRARAYQVRKQDPDFASAWEEAEESAADALEAEVDTSCARVRVSWQVDRVSGF